MSVVALIFYSNWRYRDSSCVLWVVAVGCLQPSLGGGGGGDRIPENRGIFQKLIGLSCSSRFLPVTTRPTLYKKLSTFPPGDGKIANLFYNVFETNTS
jgi:hypothetical protein